MDKEHSKKTIPEDIVRLRKTHKQAYKYLSDALSSDEQDDASVEHFQTTLNLYEKGLLLLEHGIAIEIKGSGDDYDRALVLQDKMKGNLDHTKSRADELTDIIANLKCVSNNEKEKKDEDTKPAAKPVATKKPLPDKSKGKTTTPRATNGISNGTKSSVKTTTYKKPTAGTSTSTGPSTYGLRSSSNKTTPSSSKTTKGIKQPTKEETKKVSNLKNVDSKHANTILSEVIEQGRGVSFDDIGGMVKAKQILREIVILPSMRPELFTGLRAPARGVLLFGPPGNGKTLLAKAVATEANSVFFNISAATLTSKWVGEGEKLVRAIFAVARELQPAIIFIDEIDSLLCERKEGEHEASRRLKTEFLVGFDGVISEADERILVVGATNRPWELDDAALRRLVKRVHVPLPDHETRVDILKKTVIKQPNATLSNRDFDEVARLTDGYSGSDLTALARDAALVPIRELKPSEIESMPADQIRALSLRDFKESLKTIRPSVSQNYLTKFNDWNKTYGAIA